MFEVHVPSIPVRFKVTKFQLNFKENDTDVRINNSFTVYMLLQTKGAEIVSDPITISTKHVSDPLSTCCSTCIGMVFFQLSVKQVLDLAHYFSSTTMGGNIFTGQ